MFKKFIIAYLLIKKNTLFSQNIPPSPSPKKPLHIVK